MRRFKVRCSYELVVEIPNDVDPTFYLEENLCPGTGVLGGKLEELMELHDNSNTCWACACQGKVDIIEEVR